MAEWKVEFYTDNFWAEWDAFVMKESMNGTVLQTRKFLSYHPKERFEDCSILIREKERIVAVCPACVVFENNCRVFFSHGGSTYGGIIISQKICKVEKIFQLIKVVEDFLRTYGFREIIYKQTPELLCRIKGDLLEFAFKYNGYVEKQELNFYIDFSKYCIDIIKNFNQCRRRLVRKCVSKGMLFKEIHSKEEIGLFYEILSKNLKKYNKIPVHTQSELELLKRILGKEVSFWGVHLDGSIVAGAMLFHFENVNYIHTHYLASDPDLNKYSPMSFLYFSLIEYGMKNGYSGISWGIATDHDGNINWNLSNTKESYGSVQGINRIYSKRL